MPQISNSRLYGDTDDKINQILGEWSKKSRLCVDKDETIKISRLDYVVKIMEWLITS